MKKRILVIVLVLSVFLSIAAVAVENYQIPSLRFSGTTAICSIMLIEPDKEIDVRLTLWHGDDIVYYWDDSGIGTVSIEGRVGVTRGEEYTLTLTGTIDEEDIGEISVSRVC